MTPSSASGLGGDDYIVLLSLLCMAGTLLFLAIRHGLITLKEREVKRVGAQLMAERDALEERANALEARQSEIETQKAALADLEAEKLMLTRRGKKRASGSRRFIHEIGRPEPGRHLFRFPLSMSPGATQRPDAKAVVHPAIWPFQNEAQVWAADFPAAQMLTRSIFNDAVGVVIGAAPDSDAPDAPVQPAPADPPHEQGAVAS